MVFVQKVQPRSQAGVRAMQNVFAITVSTRECKMNHTGSAHESLNTDDLYPAMPNTLHFVGQWQPLQYIQSFLWCGSQEKEASSLSHYMQKLHVYMDSGSFYSVEPSEFQPSEVYVEIFPVIDFLLSFCIVWSFFPLQNCEFASFEELVSYALAYEFDHVTKF